MYPEVARPLVRVSSSTLTTISAATVTMSRSLSARSVPRLHENEAPESSENAYAL